MKKRILMLNLLRISITLIVLSSCKELKEGIKIKCNSDLSSDDCHKKFYWSYTPYWNGVKWVWHQCSTKRNWTKLRDFSFVTYQRNADSVTLSATKGGVFGNKSYGVLDFSMNLIKVATLKKVKDNYRAYEIYGCYHPTHVFENSGLIDDEYTKVYQDNKEKGMSGKNCTNYDCVSQGIKDDINAICNWYQPNTNKPGETPSKNTGGGSTNPTGCSNEHSEFEAGKIASKFHPVPREQERIYPVFHQDRLLEDDFGSTQRDIYFDELKDRTGQSEAMRYVYANALIKDGEWNEALEPNSYFTIKLRTPKGGIYDREINLKTCKNYPKYDETEKRICRDVLAAFQNPDKSVNYTVRFPIEESGYYTFQLLKFVEGRPAENFAEYQFNVLRSNTITYDKDKPTAKSYTSSSRNLALTLLNFPQSSVPDLRYCRLDAFSNLEETLEDAFALNERAELRREKLYPGLDVVINECSFEGEISKKLSYIIDENQVVKLRASLIKKDAEDFRTTYEYALFKQLSLSADLLAKYYAHSTCPTNAQMVENDPTRALALMVKEVKYVADNYEIMDTGSDGMLVEGNNKGVQISADDRQNFRSPDEIMGRGILAYTLPNVPGFGYSAGRVSILFYNYIKLMHKTYNFTITPENYASIVLAHELGHVWANRYMMDYGKPDAGDAHQAFCTGKDECECVFRYDNQTIDWTNRTNTKGVKYCEAHRQLILNQLLRKY